MTQRNPGASRGRVRVRHQEEGWGVVDSPDTPGGCWVHFSDVVMNGYRSLEAGEDVGFDFEVAEQDGFRFRAVRVFLGSRSGAEGTPVRADTDAYGSVLRFEK